MYYVDLEYRLRTLNRQRRFCIVAYITAIMWWKLICVRDTMSNI